MVRITVILLVAFFSFTFVGCSGVEDGKMLSRSGFSGVAYETETESGIVSSEGYYRYKPGENVTFKIGKTVIGTTEARPNLTLADLVEINEDEENQEAVNTARFMMTLDFDNNPNNGIEIVEQIRALLIDTKVDFKKSVEEFETEMTDLLKVPLVSSKSSEAFLMLGKLDSEQSNSVVDGNIEDEDDDSSSVATESGVQYSLTATDEELLEANNVINAMLSNKINDSKSQLEYLSETHDIPLTFESEEGSESIIDRYLAYKKRLDVVDISIDHIERNELTSDNSGADIHNYKSVHYSLLLSDIHIEDEESPVTLEPFEKLVSSAYHSNGSHIVYQTNDIIKTARAVSRDVGRDIEMSLLVGDLVDLSQYNEIRWGIDLLDGNKVVHPDSGIDDDPIEGLNEYGQPNDTSDPVNAVGFSGNETQNEIPWYYTTGNHDGLFYGNVPITNGKKILGVQITKGTRYYFDKLSTASKSYFGFDPSLNLKELLVKIKNIFTGGDYKYVAPDEDRRFISPDQIASEMFNTTGTPVGHGMNLVEKVEDGLFYTFNTSGGLIKYIVLDTGTFYAQGKISSKQYKWLKSELKKSVKEDQLVVISSHHKPKDIYSVGWSLGSKKLVKLLNKYPSVIAHIVGHRHQNLITPRSADKPENGYWEIELDSLVAWPQQARLFEIAVDPSTGYGKMFTTAVGHEGNDYLRIGNRGRFLAYLEGIAEGKGKGLLGKEGAVKDRNAILNFKIPSNVLDRIQGISNSAPVSLNLRKVIP